MFYRPRQYKRPIVELIICPSWNAPYAFLFLVNETPIQWGAYFRNLEIHHRLLLSLSKFTSVRLPDPAVSISYSWNPPSFFNPQCCCPDHLFHRLKITSSLVFLLFALPPFSYSHCCQRNYLTCKSGLSMRKILQCPLSRGENLNFLAWLKKLFIIQYLLNGLASFPDILWKRPMLQIYGSTFKSPTCQALSLIIQCLCTCSPSAWNSLSVVLAWQTPT